ncbi:hypothetical protein RUND412_000206 [Rhizina undulata]
MSLLILTSKSFLRSAPRPHRIPHIRLHVISPQVKSTAVPSPVSLPTVPANVSSGSYGLGSVIRIFHRYGQAQRRRPYWTQLWTSLAIYFLGDINAQMLSGNGDYDPLRTARMCFIGGVISIPSFRWLFIFLNENFNFRSKILAVATRVVVNQITFTPLFLTSFFGLQGAMTGLGGKEIVEKLEATLPQAFVNSCRLWPMVSAINFWLVPFEYRALLSGVIAVGWNGYLSYLNQQAQLPQALELQPSTPAPISVPVPRNRSAPSITDVSSASAPPVAIAAIAAFA